MRKPILLFIFTISLCCNKAIAQEACDFEKLFSTKPGMDMPSVVAILQQNSKITLISQQSETLKARGGTNSGDSILHMTLTYRVDSSNCLHGRKDLVKFDFADGKLYKAYIETDYSQHEFANMMSNFDHLHKRILQSWPHEKTITIKGDGIEGFGYDFYKTTDKNAKANMCELQYIKTRSGNPPEDNYKLEILWVNLNNTRMENISY
jgi:hypothetical protein